jgi:hypothetical protein
MILILDIGNPDTSKFVARDASKIKDCRHGRFMYLQNDAYIGRSLDVYGEYCEGEIDIFRQLLRPGDVAMDVGANIGALTQGMAQMVQSAGAVVTFEPQRTIYDILCNNLRLNAVTNPWFSNSAIACGGTSPRCLIRKTSSAIRKTSSAIRCPST